MSDDDEVPAGVPRKSNGLLTSTVVLGGGIGLILVALLFWAVVIRPGQAEREERNRLVEDLIEAGAASDRAAASASAAAEKKRLENIESLRRRSSALTASSREEWVRSCVRARSCDGDEFKAIVEGAPANERESCVLLGMAMSAERFAKRCKDGSTTDIEQVTNLTDNIALNGLAVLPKLEQADLRDAKKDPQTTRGKAVVARGAVVEIRTTKGITEGTLATDSGTYVRFLTPLSTASIYDGSSATFRGVFVQEYDFGNVSGGQTRSLLVVGAFDLGENKRGTRPLQPVTLAWTARS